MSNLVLSLLNSYISVSARNSEVVHAGLLPAFLAKFLSDLILYRSLLPSGFSEDKTMPPW